MARNNQLVLSVSRLNTYVRTLLENDMMLSWFRLEGEVSGFREVASGHWYFTLKDEMAAVSCVMYRSSVAKCSISPKNGMHVQVSGKVSLYEKNGVYQVIAQSMRPAGIGSIYQALAQLKEKLDADGIFRDERKRPLPFRPRKIAVVTSPTGAVIHDICHVAAARDAGIPIVLVPTLVQGEEAAQQIAAALSVAGALPEVDEVILARGGGSMEDLWCFNEECVVRAIVACPVPVISAVGHESDVTLSDLAADRRASTPSNAAEIAVPEQSDMRRRLNMLGERMYHAATKSLFEKDIALLRLKARLEGHNPSRILLQERQKLQRCSDRMDAVVAGKLAMMRNDVSLCSGRLEKAASGAVASRDMQLRQMEIRLKLLNPQNVLERGYAIVTSGDRVISSSREAVRQKELCLQFHDGSVATVPTSYSDKETK